MELNDVKITIEWKCSKCNNNVGSFLTNSSEFNFDYGNSDDPGIVYIHTKCGNCGYNESVDILI